MTVKEMYHYLGSALSAGLDPETQIEIAFDGDVRHGADAFIITKFNRVVLCDESEIDTDWYLNNEIDHKIILKK